MMRERNSTGIEDESQNIDPESKEEEGQIEENAETSIKPEESTEESEADKIGEITAQVDSFGLEDERIETIEVEENLEIGEEIITDEKEEEELEEEEKPIGEEGFEGGEEVELEGEGEREEIKPVDEEILDYEEISVLKEGEELPEVEVTETEGAALEHEVTTEQIQLPEGEELKDSEAESGKEEEKPAEEFKEVTEREEVSPEEVPPEEVSPEEVPPEEVVITKAGDFTIKKQASFEDIALTPEVELEYSESEEEEEEEEEVEEEEEESIDREALIIQYKELQSEARPIVKKHVSLLRKLAEHFKKRKMEHVYKHPEPYSPDKEMKYHKQLLAYEEIRKIEASERERITNELKEMKIKRDNLTCQVKEEMEKLIQRERSIGLGLVSSRTGK
ncbi:hypothetical protein L9F63_007973, partial [Diploptera punctata]